MNEAIGSIPKGYLYFAIAFSVCVEFINMKMRTRKSKNPA
jgi:predicted tellurium resistance membrane protein TerC